MFILQSYRLWDNVENYGRGWQATDDNLTRRIRFACWITKVTDIRSEYVVIIFAFSGQQWLHERAFALRFKCIACLGGSVKRFKEMLEFTLRLKYSPSNTSQMLPKFCPRIVGIP
jgi:hypothetical protein